LCHGLECAFCALSFCVSNGLDECFACLSIFCVTDWKMGFVRLTSCVTNGLESMFCAFARFLCHFCV